MQVTPELKQKLKKDVSVYTDKFVSDYINKFSELLEMVPDNLGTDTLEQYMMSSIGEAQESMLALVQETKNKLESKLKELNNGK